VCAFRILILCLFVYEIAILNALADINLVIHGAPHETGAACASSLRARAKQSSAAVAEGVPFARAGLADVGGPWARGGLVCFARARNDEGGLQRSRSQ
jgi:hypothetical protein